MIEQTNIIPIKDDITVNAGAALRASLLLFKENAALLAEYRKIDYDAYIKQGFTPEQALELCK